MKDNVQESEAKWCCEGDGKDGHTPECRYSDPKTFVAAAPERGAPPEKPVCLICGLPPDHEWHGVSNHVYVPKLAGHDSAGAAQPDLDIDGDALVAERGQPSTEWLARNSPSPEVRQAWEEGRDEVCNMLVYAGAALDRGSPLKDCLASLVESGKAMQYPGPAAPPATKEGK